MLLEEGVALLLARGLPGASDVRLKDVCESLEARTGIRVTPGSVYERMWVNQRAYQVEVLAQVLRSYGIREFTTALDAGLRAVERGDLATPAGREAAKRRFCWDTAIALMESLDGSRPWHIWIAVWGAIASTPERRDDTLVGAELEAGYTALTQAFADHFTHRFAALGYELRPGVSAYQFATAVGALTEGLALRLRHDRDHSDEMGTHTPDDEPVEWGLIAICFEAVADRFYAPDSSGERGSCF